MGLGGGMKPPQARVARQLPHGGADLARWWGHRGVRGELFVVGFIGDIQAAVLAGDGDEVGVDIAFQIFG